MYVSNKDLLISAKAGNAYEVGYTLVDPNSRSIVSNKAFGESHRIEEADTTATVLVKEDTKEDSDPKTPGTGIQSVASLFYILLMLISGLFIVISLKVKRKRA